MTDVTEDAPNEILAAARAAKAQSEAAAKALSEKIGTDKAGHWPIGKIGIGVGIGSAAVAAAVLFANRNRPKK